jgi:hypothetical protein
LVASPTSASEPATSAPPQIVLVSPLDFQVVQRLTRSEGTLIIAGSVLVATQGLPLPDKLEFRLSGSVAALGASPEQWQPLPFDDRVAAFRRELTLPAGGWYQLEVRALRQDAEVARTTVEHIGLGEVFVVAGQSNSANYGEKRQKTLSGRVAAFDGTRWQLADDPQPGAGGSRGSFMPAFGDALAERLGVPIGIVAMGIGSTSVREWLPAGTRLNRLPPRTGNVVTVGPGQWEPAGKIFNRFTERMKQFGPHGFRAVLWHQGESDANQADPGRTLPGSLYREYLEKLIRDSRREIGWDVPWFVAQVSYHNPRDASSSDIRAAQKALWDSSTALEGPDTDTLTGAMRDKNGTGVHLSAEGLRAHGHLWAEKVGPWLERQLGKPTSGAR